MTTTPIPPFNDGWHREALAAVQQTNDLDDVLLVAASAEEDGKHFVYLRCNEGQARDLHDMLSKLLAERDADRETADNQAASSR